MSVDHREVRGRDWASIGDLLGVQAVCSLHPTIVVFYDYKSPHSSHYDPTPMPTLLVAMVTPLTAYGLLRNVASSGYAGSVS